MSTGCSRGSSTSPNRSTPRPENGLSPAWRSRQLDAAHPGRYNQAIMDFGAIQCTPASPRCEACPLSESCLALAAGTVADRPVKRGKTRVRDRWFNYLHVASGDRVLLHRREGRDIWQGLYEFPLIETDAPVEFPDLAALPQFRRLLGDGPWASGAQRFPAPAPAVSPAASCGRSPHRNACIHSGRRCYGRPGRLAGRLCRAAARRPLPDAGRFGRLLVLNPASAGFRSRPDL